MWSTIKNSKELSFSKLEEIKWYHSHMKGKEVGWVEMQQDCRSWVMFMWAHCTLSLLLYVLEMSHHLKWSGYLFIGVYICIYTLWLILWECGGQGMRLEGSTQVGSCSHTGHFLVLHLSGGKCMVFIITMLHNLNRCYINCAYTVL